MDQISKKKKFKRFINFHAIELFHLLPFFYHIENGVVVKALITNTMTGIQMILCLIDNYNLILSNTNGKIYICYWKFASWMISNKKIILTNKPKIVSKNLLVS